MNGHDTEGDSEDAMIELLRQAVKPDGSGSAVVKKSDDEGDRAEKIGGRLDRRQLAKLPSDYVMKAGRLEFDPRLAYEIALNLKHPEELFDEYGFTEKQAAALAEHPAFKHQVAEFKKEIEANGVSFKMKARIQAEDLLTHSYALATDAETPASVRADLIKWTAEVADLNPAKRKTDVTAQGANSLELKIIFPKAVDTGPKVISGERVDDDD